MASTIQIKSGTGSAIPASLSQAELAINVDSGSLYYGAKGGTSVSSSFYFHHVTSSGTVKAEHLYSTDDAQINGTITLGSDGEGIVKGDDAGTKITWDTRAIDFRANNSHVLTITDGAMRILKPITEHITASGTSGGTNISASGDIICDRYVPGHDTTGITIAGNITASGGISFLDNRKAVFGSDNDGSIEHTGTNLQIKETIGNIQLINYANDKDIVLSTDDGSGGTTPYITLDGSDTSTTIHTNLTSSGEISSSGNFYGNNIGSTYDNYIYLTPADFYAQGTPDVRNPHTIGDNGAYLEDNSRLDYWAMAVIPNGYIATHAVVYSNNPAADTYTVYSSSIGASGGALSVGICGSSTATNTEKDITDITGGSGTYAVLIWNPNGSAKRCYGGRITLTPNF